jgi:fructose-bisphosphate aldolase, class II
MLATLNDLLPAAAAGGYAVPCFNVFGSEEVVAILAAASGAGRGVILACNKDMADHLGVIGFAGMVRGLAEVAPVPVCVHLDHCYEEERIHAALQAGFTSVMFDGSQLPLADNIARSAAMARLAHRFGATLEGEVGSVPYTEGRDHIKSELTTLADAQAFAEHSGVDAMAISVGNVHRQTQAVSRIDFGLVARIAQATTLPLVIHGTSGIRAEDIRRLKQMRVAKFNIGTSLRQAFNRSLRQSLADTPERFDRLQLMRPVVTAVQAEARRMLDLLG